MPRKSKRREVHRNSSTDVSILNDLQKEFKKEFPDSGRVNKEEVFWICGNMQMHGLDITALRVIMVRGNRGSAKPIQKYIDRFWVRLKAEQRKEVKKHETAPEAQPVRASIAPDQDEVWKEVIFLREQAEATQRLISSMAGRLQTLERRFRYVPPGSPYYPYLGREVNPGAYGGSGHTSPYGFGQTPSYPPPPSFAANPAVELRDRYLAVLRGMEYSGRFNLEKAGIFDAAASSSAGEEQLTDADRDVLFKVNLEEKLIGYFHRKDGTSFILVDSRCLNRYQPYMGNAILTYDPEQDLVMGFIPYENQPVASVVIARWLSLIEENLHHYGLFGYPESAYRPGPSGGKL